MFPGVLWAFLAWRHGVVCLYSMRVYKTSQGTWGPSCTWMHVLVHGCVDGWVGRMDGQMGGWDGGWMMERQKYLPYSFRELCEYHTGGFVTALASTGK